LRRSVVCAEELVFRQYAGLQEQLDQPHHLLVGHAAAQSSEKVVVRNLVKTALDVALDNPWIRQSAPPIVLVAFLRQGGSAEVLQSAMTASSGPKPVRDMPELRFEDMGSVFVEIPLSAKRATPWDHVWKRLEAASANLALGGETGWKNCAIEVRQALDAWRKIDGFDAKPSQVAKQKDKRLRLNDNMAGGCRDLAGSRR
jgi:hypothetical protein